jgi:hypothetical protein
MPDRADIRALDMSVARRADGSGRTGLPCTHVFAELEPTAVRIRLHVTEDDASFGVTARCADVAAEAFDVQLDAHRVWIGRSATAKDGREVVSPRHDRRGVDRLLSLCFDQPIDALQSHGECADGWLRLSLRKLETRARA